MSSQSSHFSVFQVIELIPECEKYAGSRFASGRGLTMTSFDLVEW